MKGRQKGQSQRRRCDEGSRGQRCGERFEDAVPRTGKMEEGAKEPRHAGAPLTTRHSLCLFLLVTSDLWALEGSSPGPLFAGQEWKLMN